MSDAGAERIAENLFGDNLYKDRPKIALQLFIYDLLLESNNMINGRRLLDSVYSTVRIFGEPPASVEVGQSFMSMMKEKTGELLDEIGDVSVPFRRTDDRDACRYCDFKSICGR